MRYEVIENTPGYLPDADEPAEFPDLASAKQYLKEEVERYLDFLVDGAEDGTPEDEIFSVWWSEDLEEAYINDHSKIRDLGRNFSIVYEEEDLGIDDATVARAIDLRAQSATPLND